MCSHKCCKPYDPTPLGGDAVAEWTYDTLQIRYDAKRYKDYAVEYKDGSALVGLKNILKTYGEQGWELVSLTPESFEAVPGVGKWFLDAGAYRATFKRLQA
jgi:hypothetical protein